MITNTLTTKTMVGLLAASLFVPFLAGAAPVRATSTKERGVGAGMDICTNLTAMRAKATAHLTERAGSIEGKKGERKAKFDTGRMERAKKLTDKRSEHDTKRSEHFANLRAKASTTAQTAAVAAFESEVTRLIKVRQDAIDAKIATFEAGVLALHTEADGTVESLKAKVAADLDAIYDSAEAACASGTDGAEVRAAIKSDLDEMRTNHKANRAEYSFKEEFEALRKARVAATEAAMADFKAGMLKATADLKAAFGR